MPINLRRVFRTPALLGAVGGGAALALATASVLAAPAAAAVVGTITLNPTSGAVTANPFAEFSSSAPCPSGYGEAAGLYLVASGWIPELATVETRGLDTKVVTAKITTSLAELLNKGGLSTVPTGSFPLELKCFNADFDPVVAFTASITIANGTWTWAPPAVPSSPTATPSAGASTSPSAGPSPTPSVSTSSSASPSATPTEDPTEDPTETPSETPAPSDSPGGSGPPADTSGDLPTTGPSVLSWLYVAVVLVIAGAGVVLWVRRQELIEAGSRFRKP